MSTLQQGPSENLDEKATLRARVVELKRENDLLKEAQGAYIEAGGGLQTSGTEGTPELGSLQHICTVAPIGLCHLDTNLRYVFVNEWLAAINGLSVKEHLGRSISEVLPDVAAGAEAQLRGVIETGEPVVGGTVKAETAAQPGLKKCFEHYYDAVRSADGAIVGVSCVVQDVTKRVQAEEALRLAHEVLEARVRERTEELLAANKSLQASEERFALALEATSEGLWDWNIATGEMFCSPPWCKALGFDPSEVEPHIRFWNRLMHPEDMPRVTEVLNAHFQGKTELFECEVRLRMKSGEYRWILDRGKVVTRDEDGKPLRMVGVDVDITERRRAEQALRITQFAVDHNSDAIYWVRSDGRISYVNHAACQASGYSYQELVSLRVPDIDPDFPDDIWGAHFLEVKEAGSMTFESHHRTKSGRLFPVEILANYLAYDHQEYLCAHVRDITERKRAEEALSASETRFRTMFESSVIAIALSDEDGAFIETNPAFQKMFGYSARELEGMTFLELTHREDVDRGWELFRELIEGKRDGFHLEKRYYRKDRTLLLGEVTVSAIRNGDGKFRHTLAMVEDITARRGAEEALRRSEERLALALGATSEGLWDWNLASGEVFYSSQWCRALGFDPSEVEPRGRFWQKLVHPEDVPRLTEVLNAHFEGKTESFQCEVRLRTKSGQYRWTLDRGKVVARDQDGKPLRMVGVDVDITERKRAEEALRESEERFRVVFESAPFGMVVLDAAGTPLRYNRAFQEMLGYSEQELGKKDMAEYTHSDDVEDTRRLFAELRQGKRDLYQIEKRYVRKDGKIVWGNLAFSSVRDAQGDVQYLIATVKNITERKRAEEQARQLQADLAHMSRLSSMGEMATGLAHELNQPLTVITNYAQGCVRRLKSNAIGPEELGDILGRIATQARRSGSIIQGLENLVRKSSALRFEIDINQSIMEMAELANAEAAQHHAKARFELEPNLPPVMADQTQLQQVILNLVQNGCEAIQDTPESRRAVTVRTKQRGDRELEISVSDNGCGISESLGERLFEPFFTTKAQGIGMGLAISRSIVEAHGGRLWATPNRGEGTTFHFTLPIVGGHFADE